MENDTARLDFIQNNNISTYRNRAEVGTDKGWIAYSLQDSILGSGGTIRAAIDKCYANFLSQGAGSPSGDESGSEKDAAGCAKEVQS